MGIGEDPEIATKFKTDVLCIQNIILFKQL